MTVQDLDGALRVWHVSELHTFPITELQAHCVVVAIGGAGNYLPALQLAAREAKHSGLAVKLVHGSGTASEDTPNARQSDAGARRGRRLLDAAAMELHRLDDDDVPVYTCNSSDTGVETLLRESSTAPLIVMQRTETAGETRGIPGSTMSAVAAQACCPVALAPSGHAGRVSTGLLTRMDGRDSSALARIPEWAEAGLRRVPLTVTHSWDGPLTHTLTSAHLAPSQKDVQGDRANDLRRLAAMVAAMEDARTPPAGR